MKWLATLAVAAAAVGICSAAAPCPDGFTNLGTETIFPKCLAFASSKGTWHNSLEICKLVAGSYNGSLAKVTGDLHNTVYNYILDHPALMDACFWIGGSDEAREGEWVWSIDKTIIPLKGPHWEPCRPEPDGGYNENYLAICPDKYYFKDYPGDRMHHALCQVFL